MFCASGQHLHPVTFSTICTGISFLWDVFLSSLFFSVVGKLQVCKNQPARKLQLLASTKSSSACQHTLAVIFRLHWRCCYAYNSIVLSSMFLDKCQWTSSDKKMSNDPWRFCHLESLYPSGLCPILWVGAGSGTEHLFRPLLTLSVSYTELVVNREAKLYMEFRQWKERRRTTLTK